MTTFPGCPFFKAQIAFLNIWTYSKYIMFYREDKDFVK